MEEIASLCRIDSEGRGMSAGTQEHNMNSKRIFAGIVAAAILASTSPAYAGHVGGAGGFGGGFGGSLGGLGGSSRLSGAGSLGSHGSLNDSLGSANTKPAAKVAGKTVGKVDGAAASATHDAGSDHGYAAVRGTSFAAPIVAALLAKDIASPNAADAAAAIDALAKTAIDLGPPGRDLTYGFGLVGADFRIDPTPLTHH